MKDSNIEKETMEWKEISKKIHMKWLYKAKTAKIDGVEMTVLPYGYLSKIVVQEIQSALKEKEEREEKLEFIIKDIKSYQSDGEIGTLCDQALAIIKSK